VEILEESMDSWYVPTNYLVLVSTGQKCIWQTAAIINQSEICWKHDYYQTWL